MDAIEQRRTALDRANDVRAGRKVLLDDIGRLPGRESRSIAADWVENPPEPLRSMGVAALLATVKHLGHEESWRLLEATRVHPLKELHSVPTGKRIALAAALRGEKLKRPEPKPEPKPRKLVVTNELAAIAHDALRTCGWPGDVPWQDVDPDGRRALRTALEGVLNP